MTQSPQKSTHFMGAFTLAMLSVSAIISLRNFPSTALEGTKAIFFFTIAGLFFFLPVALSCAELASGWPKKGGVYTWVTEAFGPKWGFLAIWLEWVESVVWLPTVLSFMAATTAYLFKPSLENNSFFIIGMMLTYLWGSTLLNFQGIRTSSWISTIGVIVGSLLPALVLIILGGSHINTGIKLGNLDFSVSGLFPSGNLSALVTFTAILLGFCGMEIPAYHINQVKNPQKSYPKAMFLAAFLILSISILGSLAISAVIPTSQISLVAGPMQAFSIFFKNLQLEWMSPVLAGFTLMGGIALLNTWIIGPSKGLVTSAEAGFLPKRFMRVNDKEVPTALLLLQAVVATILSSFFVFNPSIQSAYWMVNILAAQLYLMMYFILFISVIRLRYTQALTPRGYKIPGGKFGVWLVCGSGACACILAIFIGFVPPDNINIQFSTVQYVVLLLGGILVCTVPPFFFLAKNHKKQTLPK